jgi:hypothetical protein
MLTNMSTATALPHFLTVAQAAAASSLSQEDIETAIVTGDLKAADPAGKGLRIPREAFLGWMGGDHLPAWEGKSGDWIDLPVRLLMGDVIYARHPDDKYDSWVYHKDVVRVRAHTTETKLEITYKDSRDERSEGCELVECELSFGGHTIESVWKLDETHGQRRLLTKHFDYFNEAIPPEKGSPSQCNTYQALPWSEFVAFLRGVGSDPIDPRTLRIIKDLPAKVLGTEVAKALGIEDPRTGDFRRIADTMQALGWKAKKTNRGLCYYSPGLEGQARFLFGG